MPIRRNIWPPAIVLVPALVLSGTLNAAPNILLIIGDDMCVETLASYEVGENPPTTAALDELADQGVGFDHFSGLIRGETASYFSWIKVVDGEVTGTTGYTPVDKADDAIRWIEARGNDPWFLWFAL